MCKKLLPIILIMTLLFSLIIPFEVMAATSVSPTDPTVTGTLTDAVVTADPATNVDGLDFKSVNDNLLYNLAINSSGASDYTKVAHAATKSSTSADPAINTSSFYKAFDGTITTSGALNVYASGSTARVPAAVALDLGTEKYFNNVLIDAASASYPGKSLNTWNIKINNSTSDFSTLKDYTGNTLASKNQITSTNWKSIYAGTDKLGMTSSGFKQEVKVGFNRIVKSRYVMIYVGTVTTSGSFNMYFDELALYLRDITANSGSPYSVDYTKKMIKVDNFDTASSFLADFTANDANLSTGVFADAAATTAVTDQVAEGNYLVTYFDNNGTKEIVSAYQISKPIPEIKNFVIAGNPEIDSTLTATYDFKDENGNTSADYDASTFKWFKDGVEIEGATSRTYKITTADVGKSITATVTPVSVNNAVGVPVNNEATSISVAGKMGGNLLVNKTAANIKIAGNNTDGTIPGVPAQANIEKMLNGYLQDVTINTGTNNAKTVTFDVQLGSAKVVNKIAFQSYTDNLTLTAIGLLNGSEVGTLASKSNGTDSAVNIMDCTPTLVDTLRFQMVMPATTYSAGLKQLRAYGYVTSDSESVALEKAALVLPSSATTNLALRTAGGAYTNISWASDNEAAISRTGTVTRLYVDQIVNLTATITRNNALDTKTFAITVPKEQIFTLEDSVFSSSDGSTIYSVIDDIADLQSTIKGSATLIAAPLKAQAGLSYKGRAMVAHYRKNALTKLFVGDTKTVTITQEAIDAGIPYSEEIAVNVDLSAIDGGLINGDVLKLFVWDELNTLAPILEPSVLEFNGVALRFAVLSDLHIGKYQPEGMRTDEKFEDALTYLKTEFYEKDGLDAIVFAGDITDAGWYEEYTTGGMYGDNNDIPYRGFRDILTGVFPNSDAYNGSGYAQIPDIKMLYMRGNHDNYPTSGTSRKGNFAAVAPVDDYRYGGVYSANINGYTFVMASQSVAAGNGGAGVVLHDAATKAFVQSAVQTAGTNDKSGKKPIFVTMHPHVYDTVYGSYKVDNTNVDEIAWGTDDFTNILSPYKQVVTFSGHSHFPVIDERSIHQGSFTSIGTGATAYMELEKGKTDSFHPVLYGDYRQESTANYVEVYRDNTVVVKRIDLFRDSLIKADKPWIIKPIDDPNWLTYTANRDTVAPTFADGQAVSVSDITASGCVVSFAQATDEGSDVQRYRIEYVQTADNTVKASNVIWSYYFKNTDMPSSMTWTLSSGLDANTAYKVRVIAVDSFGNESLAGIESGEFVTAAQ